MKWARFSPTDSEGRSNNSVMIQPNNRINWIWIWMSKKIGLQLRRKSKILNVQGEIFDFITLKIESGRTITVQGDTNLKKR